MLYLYSFFEASSFLLGIFAALYFGNLYLPNPLAFLVVYFLFRVLCFYAFFGLLLNRVLPMARFIVEGFMIVLVTFPLSFLLFLTKDLRVDGTNPLSFPVNLNSGGFYYFVIPIMAFLTALVVHKVLKLEYWLN